MAKLTEVSEAFDTLSGEEKIVADWAYEFSKIHLPAENVEGYYKARIGTEPTVHLISHIIRGMMSFGDIEPKLDQSIVSANWIHDLGLADSFANKIFEFSPEKDLVLSV